VVLRVADTGIGMDEEEKRRAFDAFFTTKKTGTGLGLATVREQVARYEGRATVESSPGHGATFEIRLPRREAPGASAPSSTSSFSAKAAAPARVLLVEDNALVRRGLQRTLESAGFDVVSVSNGLEALGLLEKAGELAVVVTDISMPGLDGASLAQKLAVTHPELPVVLVSGNLEPSAETLAGPRRAFVEKTAPPTQILEAIERVRAVRGDGG
jgi:two-component system, cell cycle sensor histidine kinase and response regulator CckA